MRVTSFSRSVFETTAASSLPAEVLIRTLYEATTLHALHEAVEGNTPLLLTPIKGRKIGRIFSQRHPHRLIDEIGNGAIVRSCAQAKGLVDLRLKIHGGALRGTHGRMMI